MIIVKEYRGIGDICSHVEDILNELEISFYFNERRYSDNTIVKKYLGQRGNVSVFVHVESIRETEVEYSTAISSILKKLGLTIRYDKIKIDIHEKRKNKKINTPESLSVCEDFLRKLLLKTQLAGG